MMMMDANAASLMRSRAQKLHSTPSSSKKFLLPYYAVPLIALSLLASIGDLNVVEAIQCYSGSQMQIIECPSLSCIKQTLGLDTVRYCDGTGVSSICQTYRILDSCQNIPNLGLICCCSDQICNSAPRSAQSLALSVAILSAAGLAWLFRSVLSNSKFL